MIKSGVFLTAIVTLTLGCSPQTASADQIPGLRGHDHTGITVPDVKAATAFFTDVVGCTHAMSFGPFSDDKGTFMQDVVNVNPRAVIDEISMVRCGYGSNIELFQYESPDQAKDMPKNSDIGGHHLAFYVDDMDAAVAYLRDKGLRVLGEPTIRPAGTGPNGGSKWVYFLSPWGMQLELVSFPNGKDYEKQTTARLWHPAHPEK